MVIQASNLLQACLPKYWYFEWKFNFVVVLRLYSNSSVIIQRSYYTEDFLIFPQPEVYLDIICIVFSQAGLSSMFFTSLFPRLFLIQIQERR